MSYGDFERVKGFEVGFATSVVNDVLDGSNGYAQGPERALLSALLFDGIQSYIHYVLATSHKVRSRYFEAYRWVSDRSTDYAFAFNNVCEALGVNPEYLRYGLANTSVSQLTEMSKSRRNF